MEPKLQKVLLIAILVITTVSLLVNTLFFALPYLRILTAKTVDPSSFETQTSTSENSGAPQAPQSVNPVAAIESPLPTPKGPGNYACSPEGSCNLYGDKERSNCPVTFADSECLKSCENTSKRCSR